MLGQIFAAITIAFQLLFYLLKKKDVLTEEKKKEKKEALDEIRKGIETSNATDITSGFDKLNRLH